MKKFLFIALYAFIVAPAHSHDDNESRIEFWKKYYNPKVEVTSNKVPSVDISLIKNKPFYQIKTTVKNFIFTPEKNMKNNLPSEGYGKLYINGEYVSRIYSEYHFVKILPVGVNEIKVILSTNQDHDVANKGEVIAKGMLITESSAHLKCRHDARNDVLGPFIENMTRLQRHYHKVTLDALTKRIEVWKAFEDEKISLENARLRNQKIEDEIDDLMQQKLEQLESAQK